MVRALIELLLIIVATIVARAVLSSVLKGIANASSSAFQKSGAAQSASAGANSRPPETPPGSGSELHKDPVCGTFVAESSPFQRRSPGHTFYYCSDSCKDKHALVAR
jgi:YHS domain-containing protein